MANVTIASTVVPDFHYSGTTFTLRIFSDRQWTALDRTVVPARGDTSAFYREYTISVSGTNATIPTVILASQTDAPNEKNGRYLAYYYVDGVEKDMFLANTLGAFQVPDTPTSTDWTALEQYNFNTPRRWDKDQQTYPALVIDQKIAANLSTPTIPLVVGGAGATSFLELRSTSGVGTTDFVKVTVGNNGATEVMRLVHSGNVGISSTNTSPTFKLTVSNNTAAAPTNSGGAEMWIADFVMADSVPGGIGIDSFGPNSLETFSILDFRTAGGTAAAPSAIPSGRIIGVIGAFGYGTTAYSGGTAQIRWMSKEAFTDTAHGSRLVFLTTPTGSPAGVDTVERLSIDSAGLTVTGGIAATLNQNNASSLAITNTTSGTGAIASFVATSDSSKSVTFASNSTLYSTIPLYAASGSVTTNWNTLRLAAVGVSGVIKLATGGVTAGNDRVTIDSTGNVVVGTAALVTTATNGFLYVPTCAGTPTGVPTAYTGCSPVVFDSSNNKLYVYNGSWKGVVVA